MMAHHAAHLWAPFLPLLPLTHTFWLAAWTPELGERGSTQMKGHHVSELNTDHLGEGEPRLLHTSLKFLKLYVGAAVINPVIC